MSSVSDGPGSAPGPVASTDSPAGDLYLAPTGIIRGAAAAAAVAARMARPLAGGSDAFLACEVIERRGAETRRRVLTLAALHAWAREKGRATAARVEARLEALAGPPRTFAGRRLDRPLVMGIVNVTPDSFSDGGRHLDPEAAIAHGRALAAAGADILDIGGESTRPGAEPVPEAEERARVVPVVEGLADEPVILSIDTRRAGVMAAALAAGAQVVNDVTALAGDPDSLSVVAASEAAAILVHMAGEPATMQDDPRYGDAPSEVYDWLESRVAACLAAGIPRERLAVDPGIGFGKTPAHNFAILARLGLYHGLGCALVVGLSRKLVARGAGGPRPAPAERLPESLAGALAAVEQGAHVVRVHDVAATRRAVALAEAIAAAR